MTRLIEILGEQPWYRDGLDINEKVGLAGLFRTYNFLLSGSRNPITGQQEFAFDGEYDFSALYFSAIEDKRFSVTRPGENWLTFVALGDVADEKTAEEALEYAKTYINPVTQFAGVISAPTVVLIIEPELRPCGTADEQRYLIRLRPDCMSPVLVIHEMTHLATPFILETWFEEGSAYWLSLHLTNQWGRPSILDLLKENPAPPFDSNCCIGEPGGHTAAANGGMFFFYELEKIIGPDAVGKAIKAIPSDLRQDTLAAILRATPPQHQAAVRNLITARCRNTVRGVVVSCAIPNVGPR